ncbi:DnaJ domain-containing protein [Myxococcaceae bacterium JPH2]|nr:DnaJ domain-containing protein [Myxococcaceae bacterium JPH2]
MAEGEVRQYWVRNDRGTVWGPLTPPTIELLVDSGSIKGTLQVSEDGLNFAFPWRFPDVRDVFPREMWGDAGAATAQATSTARAVAPIGHTPVPTSAGAMASGMGAMPMAGPGAAPVAAPMTGPAGAPMAGPGARPGAMPMTGPGAGPGAMPMAGPGAAPVAGPGSIPMAGPGAAPVAGPGAAPMAGPGTAARPGAAPGAPRGAAPVAGPGVTRPASGPLPPNAARAGAPGTAPRPPHPAVAATRAPTAPVPPTAAARPPAPASPPVAPPAAANPPVPTATARPPAPASSPTVAPAEPPAVVPDSESPLAPPSQGRLEQHSPIRLYGRIGAGEHTGLLTLTLADRTQLIHFRKGNPEFVDSSHADDALGTSLMGAKLITGEQLHQADAARDRFGGDLLTALFGLGLLQPATAFTHLTQRAQLLLTRALRAEAGTFTFEPKELPGAKAMPLGNRWAVLSDAVRRLPPADLKRRLAAVMQLPIMKSGGIVAATDLRLTPHEVRALSVIDGVRSVAQLLTDFPQDADHLLRLAFLLKELDAVSFAAPNRTPAVADATAAQPSTAGVASPGPQPAASPGTTRPGTGPGAASPSTNQGAAPTAGPGVARPAAGPTAGPGAAPTAGPGARPAAAAPGAARPTAGPGAAPAAGPGAARPAAGPGATPGAARPATAPAAAPTAGPGAARPGTPPSAPARPAPPVVTSPSAPAPAAAAASGPGAEEIPALRQLATAMKQQNHFQRLGLSEQTEAGPVKLAYFRLAKQYHPDTLPQGAPPELEKLKAEVFAYIGDAYRTLSDDKSRANYLEELKSGGAGNEVDVQSILMAEELFQKSCILVKARKFPEAVKMLDEAIKLNAEEAEFYAWRGYARFFTAADKKAAQPEAFREIQNAIKRNERCAPAHYFLGVIAKLCGDATSALKHFKRTVELQPDHIDAMREIRMATQKK